MVDLGLLHALRVLHAQGTVTAAAEALHISPSALSQQLRRLSKQAGAELLQAEGRRVRLTAAGQVLLHHADLMCAQWERARADLDEQADSPHRTLALGGFATSIGPLLAPVARRLLHGAAPTRTRIVEADTQDCYQRLLAGQLDIAVLAPAPDSPPTDDPRFEQHSLMEDVMDLVVPAGHRFAGHEDIDLGETAAEDWIAPHHDQRRLIQAHCTTSGFTPKLVHHTDDWQAVLALIGQGLGICLVPRMVPQPVPQQVVRLRVDAPRPPSRHVRTCVRHGSIQDSVIAAGLAALRAQAETTAALPPEVT